MSDTPEAFRRRTEAMCDRVIGQMEAIAKRYIILASTDAVKLTRGFGRQKPEDTPYIPTGQLRGGWYWGLEKIDVASVWDGGPRSDYGAEPIAEITLRVNEAPMHAISFLQNPVAYGIIVHEGRGRHRAVGPDRWLNTVRANSHAYAHQARQEVMGAR